MHELLLLQLMYLEKEKGTDFVRDNKDKFLSLFTYYKDDEKVLKKLHSLFS